MSTSLGPVKWFPQSTCPVSISSAWCLFVFVYLCLYLYVYLCLKTNTKYTSGKSPISGPAYCLLWRLSASPSNLCPMFVCICVFISVSVFVIVCVFVSLISGPAYCLLWPLSASPSNLCPMQLVEVEATTRPLKLPNHHHFQNVEPSTKKYQKYQQVLYATGGGHFQAS